MISTRDWVDATVHLATGTDASGAFNLCCEQTPTNGEMTRELGRLVHRPTFARVPAAVLRPTAGELAKVVLDSVNARPAALLASGYSFHDPDVSAVLREGLAPSR
jgi:NAD dependent epimerase/dehydratase family enzyme